MWLFEALVDIINNDYDGVQQKIVVKVTFLNLPPAANSLTRYWVNDVTYGIDAISVISIHV